MPCPTSGDAETWPLCPEAKLSFRDRILGKVECEVKWTLGSITTNKASRGDGIPVGYLKS